MLVPSMSIELSPFKYLNQNSDSHVFPVPGPFQFFLQENLDPWNQNMNSVVFIWFAYDKTHLKSPGHNRLFLSAWSTPKHHRFHNFSHCKNINVSQRITWFLHGNLMETLSNPFQYHNYHKCPSTAKSWISITDFSWLHTWSYHQIINLINKQQNLTILTLPRCKNMILKIF